MKHGESAQRAGSDASFLFRSFFFGQTVLRAAGSFFANGKVDPAYDREAPAPEAADRSEVARKRFSRRSRLTDQGLSFTIMSKSVTGEFS
jgi:hypothetical protein